MAYQQALLAKLSAAYPLIQAQSELGLGHPVGGAHPQGPQNAGGAGWRALREELPRGRRLALQPPQDYTDLAGRLIAQSKLKGSLQGMEALERPVSGVREEVGGVTFGGVRLKRRS